MTVHTLYGTPMSLYTGKARSYLIKNALPYREVTPATIHFAGHVAERAGRGTMPTIETADGVVVRDGAAIVEHFESLAGHPAAPPGPRQRIVSRLLDVIGMEGLLRPAMHYRWSFPEENHDEELPGFTLKSADGAIIDLHRDREARRPSWSSTARPSGDRRA